MNVKVTTSVRRVRVLLKALRDGTLDPTPDFQRRLVWTNKDKLKFIETVLKGFPFPEIYVAAGGVNTETGEGIELLVDGQQRVVTLSQYFSGSKEIPSSLDVPNYQSLTEDQKVQFLEYEVVVRDLGVVTKEEIVEIFERINATQYSLNPMEVHNARFRGEFKDFAIELANHSFFSEHRIFSSNEIRRTADVTFCLNLVITILFTYFHRNDFVERYLIEFNESFDGREDIRDQIETVLSFVERCDLHRASRAWNRADLFSLLVEVHRALYRRRLELEPQEVSPRLTQFYDEVDNRDKYDEAGELSVPRAILDQYFNASVQGSNDRGSRVYRGSVIQSVISGEPLVAKPNQDLEEQNKAVV